MQTSSYMSEKKRGAPLEQNAAKAKKAGSSLSNSDLLASLGPSKTLPAGVREKMESSFGMSLSDVKLFESPVVSENGAAAAASGKSIAFAPGKLDFTSASGQTLLGHELSHVASQARGEVTGHGYLKNPSLEHQADVEGAKAASGEKLYSAGGLTPMSTDTGLSAGPMQAKESKKERKAREADESEASNLETYFNTQELSGKIETMRIANLIDTTKDLDESNEKKNPLAKMLTKLNHQLLSKEGITELMHQQAGSARDLLAYRELMKEQSQGQAITTDDKGTVHTQESADEDLATLKTINSPELLKYQSYTTLLKNMMMSERQLAKAKEYSKFTKDYDESIRGTPEYNDKLATSDLTMTDPEQYKYTMGDKAAGYEQTANAEKLKYILGTKKPWMPKKSWWHFW